MSAIIGHPVFIFLSEENINTDEKTKLVTDALIENFDENESGVQSMMKPNKTLSSFLLESEFYENLQIVRNVQFHNFFLMCICSKHFIFLILFNKSNYFPKNMILIMVT